VKVKTQPAVMAIARMRVLTLGEETTTRDTQIKEVLIVPVEQIQMGTRLIVPAVRSVTTLIAQTVHSVIIRTVPVVRSVTTLIAPTVRSVAVQTVPTVRLVTTPTVPAVHSVIIRIVPAVRSEITQTALAVHSVTIQTVPTVRLVTTLIVPAVHSVTAAIDLMVLPERATRLIALVVHSTITINPVPAVHSEMRATDSEVLRKVVLIAPADSTTTNKVLIALVVRLALIQKDPNVRLETMPIALVALLEKAVLTGHTGLQVKAVSIIPAVHRRMETVLTNRVTVLVTPEIDLAVVIPVLVAVLAILRRNHALAALHYPNPTVPMDARVVPASNAKTVLTMVCLTVVQPDSNKHWIRPFPSV
jgi:hypothetical protein